MLKNVPQLKLDGYKTWWIGSISVFIGLDRNSSGNKFTSISRDMRILVGVGTYARTGVTCATPTFSLKSYRHCKSRVIGKLVTAICEKLPAQLIFDPSQSLQEHFISATFANRDGEKANPTVAI